MEGEGVAGMRRSARLSGKRKPCYYSEKDSGLQEEEVVQTKRHPTPANKVGRVPSPASETSDSGVVTDECGVEEEKHKENGESNDGRCTVGESHQASVVLENLNKVVGDEALKMQEGSLIDPHTGAVKSAKQRVKETLRMFNTHYLREIQAEDKRVKGLEEMLSNGLKHKKNSKKADNSSNSPSSSKSKKLKKVAESEGNLKRPSKRPDLKAISQMIKNNQVLYPEKIIGHLPGIDVGDQFFSRAEMCVLGLHNHWLNGIDYIGQSKKKQYANSTLPVAVCIVLSGMYEDDLDNSEDVIYTGQGGHDLLGSKHQIGDQKLERGNLALKNNCESNVPVRVVRGHESKSSYCGKVYTYDGLYKVIKHWAEKGVSGYTIYKYRLRRLEGQPILTTNQVQFTRAQAPRSISELRGLVCEDISGGRESFPIPATNVVDDPPFAPTDFEYSKAIRLAKNVKLPTYSAGCKCRGECLDPRVCSCAGLNGGDFPYVKKNGERLIGAKAVVFECGPNCGCSGSCINRTSQQGHKYRLEVFRTANKGWAVRSWDTIPSGAPVCEYTGILRRTDEVDHDLANIFIFDIDCLQTMKGLDGREKRAGYMVVPADLDDKKADPEFCIDAGRVGNVARFINHSCEPNLFVQCVLSTHHDIKMAKVMLFAADTIPPLQELCYDYGYALDSVVRADGSIVQLPCFCGTVGCRKRLY